MITREMVSEKLLAFLDNELSLNQILAWAERVIAQGNFTPDSDVELLPKIVMRLAGNDAPQVALSTEQQSALMNRPEMAVRVVPRDAA